MNQFTDLIRTSLPASPFIARSTSVKSSLTNLNDCVKPPSLHPAGSPYGHFNGEIRHRDENGNIVLDQFHCAMCYKYACPNCGARTNRMCMNECYSCGFQTILHVSPEKNKKLQDPCDGHFGSHPQKWLKSKQILVMLAETRMLANPHLTIYEVWKQIIREQCVNRDIQILRGEYNELYNMFVRNIKIATYLVNKEYEPFLECIAKLQTKWKQKKYMTQ